MTCEHGARGESEVAQKMFMREENTCPSMYCTCTDCICETITTTIKYTI